MLEYIHAQQLIGKREVYLRYGHMFIATGFVNDHFTPEEALALLEWLEQHRPTLQQAALRTARKADQQVGYAETANGSGQGNACKDEQTLRQQYPEKVHARL